MSVHHGNELLMVIAFFILVKDDLMMCCNPVEIESLFESNYWWCFHLVHRIATMLLGKSKLENTKYGCHEKDNMNFTAPWIKTVLFVTFYIINVKGDCRVSILHQYTNRNVIIGVSLTRKHTHLQLIQAQIKRHFLSQLWYKYNNHISYTPNLRNTLTCIFQFIKVSLKHCIAFIFLINSLHFPRKKWSQSQM